MSNLKPFIRITILSSILAGLMIFLGIKYHWGEYLKTPMDQSSLDLKIPEEEIKVKTDDSNITKNDFKHELVDDRNNNTLLKSMNKEQITKYCTELLTKQVIDKNLLELAIVNCVVSNYEEVFQNFDVDTKKSKDQIQREQQIVNQCEAQFDEHNAYTFIEKELLSGICISDKLSTQ